MLLTILLLVVSGVSFYGGTTVGGLQMKNRIEKELLNVLDKYTTKIDE